MNIISTVKTIAKIPETKADDFIFLFYKETDSVRIDDIKGLCLAPASKDFVPYDGKEDMLVSLGAVLAQANGECMMLDSSLPIPKRFEEKIRRLEEKPVRKRTTRKRKTKSSVAEEVPAVTTTEAVVTESSTGSDKTGDSEDSLSGYMNRPDESVNTEEKTISRKRKVSEKSSSVQEDPVTTDTDVVISEPTSDAEKNKKQTDFAAAPQPEEEKAATESTTNGTEKPKRTRGSKKAPKDYIKKPSELENMDETNRKLFNIIGLTSEQVKFPFSTEMLMLNIRRYISQYKDDKELEGQIKGMSGGDRIWRRMEGRLTEIRAITSKADGKEEKENGID